MTETGDAATSGAVDGAVAPQVAPAHTAIPPRQGWWRRRSPIQRGQLLVRVLAGLLTAMMLMLGVGMWRNDVVISGSSAFANATVLTVTQLSTGIEFVDGSGLAQRPTHGVLYPGGLVVGQQFLVEYAADDPGVARVAGRSALNGIVMPAFVVVGTWLVALPLLWWLRRRAHRVPRGLIEALARNPRLLGHQ